MLNKKPALIIFVILLCLTAAFFSGCSITALPEPQMAVASKIYDCNNRVITTLYSENRVRVSIDQVPDLTKKAFIAIEDSRFYRHFGLDPIRIAGAALSNIKAGKIVQGGSTITQQTVKNLYLSREKTFGRKIKEAWLSIQLERRYTKDQILEMYLNQIYFGHGAYGIEVAAQTYFGKPASKLDLAESAMLAGLPKAPNTYSPFNNWEEAKKRQEIVLNRMVEVGFISEEDAKTAADEKLVLNTKKTQKEKAAYFVNEVVKYITEKYEDGAKMLFTEGISVYTSLDLDMQKTAEEVFEAGLAKYDRDLEGAFIAIEPSNGYIKAMVGGRNYSGSQFNRALQAKRQPGSAFKPFVYTAAIDNGYTQGSIFVCDQAEFPQTDGSVYRPTDYGAQPYHNRPFTLKEALTISDNVVTVKLADEIGPKTVADYARKMGIRSELRPYLSLALGTSEVTPLEITSAYCTLASMGIKTEPLMILKIVDKSGKIIEENLPEKERVLPKTTAYLVTDMLESVFQPGGTASSVADIISRPAAGKTGTTQNYRDAWFVGYTPDLAAGVYIGYDKPTKSVGASGGKIAAPIWAKFMAESLKDKPPADFPVPENIIKVKICSDSGLLATPYSPDILTASFIEGTEPKDFCDIHFYPGLEHEHPGKPDKPDEPDEPDEQEHPGMRRRLFEWFFR